MKNFLVAAALVAIVIATSMYLTRHKAQSFSTAEATASTVESNAAFASDLKLNDPVDFEAASRGLIARPSGKMLAADGTVLHDFDAYKFIDGPAPPTVNPSLWRHGRLNANIGLFKVTDGIYQLRGFDLANMTIIEGKTGWIIVDTLTSRESAAAAMAFARQQLGDKPVSAIIFSHSHIDHFGGVLGVISAEEAKRRAIPVIAPQGFMEEATSENVLVGTAMGRRSAYQFGRGLPRNAKGLVDTGLGKDVVYGTFGIMQPTRTISQPTEELTVDGVQFVFHNAPGAEAPSEMTFSIPEYKVYCAAELLNQTMHNLLPIRGAKVRDALGWSDYLDHAIDQMGGMEVMFSQHTWPVWGNAQIINMLKLHRDAYKYMHDQTVRLINDGYTPLEIADMIKLPQSLSSQFGIRGYYGDLRHNVKAIYQYYLGAYDGNPAELNPLAPTESSKHYVALMGGTDKVLAAAQTAYDNGEYRWVAELLNHAVLADPGNQAVIELLAKTYEQMGYQSESATWRNSYLTGASELRNGPPKKGVNRADFVELLMQTPTEKFLEAMAAALNGPEAEGKDYKLNLVLSDVKESYVLWIENAVLHYHKSPAVSDANATLTLTKPLFVKMMVGTFGIKDAVMSNDLKVDGSKFELIRFLSLIDKQPGTFGIVTGQRN